MSYGSRLAEVLPICLSSLGVEERSSAWGRATTAVVIVIDGLGYENLFERKGYARFLWAQWRERINTVFPSTTGAALTTITTGTLPGEHGLVGYRIRNPQSGDLVTTLSEWGHTTRVREWQRSHTVFERAADYGVRSAVIGRTAHQQSGLTSAILTGADYLAANSIEERFQQAYGAVKSDNYGIVYLYVDELDRIAHARGWQSSEWSESLESLDSEIRKLANRVDPGVGIALTADHGIIDVPASKHIFYDEDEKMMGGIVRVGGEPRMRYLYLDPTDAIARVERTRELATRWGRTLGDSALILTRTEAVASGMFGEVAPEVLERIGDVLVIAQGDHALYSVGPEDAGSRGMIGQHGGISSEEVGVPLIRIGAFA
ncbi:alkaline phosphatase family protein [Lysinibacter sp. HNR]|uniref:alkaline phosphatase family protein n=1 Tax=Lysinibacter sp. HNR TaxID=3031408 RepID=UPI00243588B1|nr:alkaline phosphatase family protein [Lysinibacter sp. HNR]WGD36339.1 alkaline phosphatase family protein [Lysinibacter sp. HNR]